MTPQEFQQVAALFEEARRLETSQRKRLLDRTCADAPDVRREVESLLAHHEDDHAALTAEGSRSALQSAAAGVLQALDEHRLTPLPNADGDSSEAKGAALPQQRIGAYTIIRELGVGGMGIVFEAQQENPRRTVALKMLRTPMASVSQLKRFQREAQVLGELHHPGIAQIFEAGTAETSAGPQPFFAMEFVDGVTLNRFAEREKLSLEQRLELFSRVCDAVAYAHHRGVVHRDLKPANVLVDKAGQPKVLDFGVARITDADLHTATLQTHAGQLIGTLAYMSPEQVAGHIADIDARSDVYSLGVMLFELLAGRLPYTVDTGSIPRATRAIQESEPTRLSSVRRAYRGDVETIVSRALEKERDRRYQRADQLAADIRRFLNDEPIIARPPTRLYQFRKFARRNRALVVGLAGVFVALAAGIVGTSVGLVRAREAERNARMEFLEAQRQTRIAEAVNKFLNDDLLSLAEPQNSPDRELTLRAAIDLAAGRIADRFQDEPLVEAALHITVGRTYRNLGEYELAEAHLKKAAALREMHLGPEHNDTLGALNHIGILYDQRGRFDEAEAIYRHVLDARLHALGPDHDDTLTSMGNLGLSLMDMGRYEEAERLLQGVYDTRHRLYDRDHQDALLAANNLASLYWEREEYGKALPWYEQVLEGRTRTLGEDHPQTITSLDNLATCLLYVNRHGEAEELNLKAIERTRRVFGPDHPKTMGALNNRASIFLAQRRFQEAEPVLVEVIDQLRRTRRPGHWTLGVSLSNLGMCLSHQQRYPEAEVSLLESHAVLSEAFGPHHRRTMNTVDHLVTLYRAMENDEQVAHWERQREKPPEEPAP